METKVDPLRQNILEAVECLRQRKCRPDRESIAHYVLRKFGSTMNEIFAELENVVDEGGLIKVEYKGTTSYRSPHSFDTKNSPLLTKHSKILNSSRTTRLILTGINELLVKDPNYTTSGVPLDELRLRLVEFDNVRFTSETLSVVLEREISCGGIHMAKSDYLTESLRVFPKDLPVPPDMHLVISLNTDDSVEMKEEKKPKKPRKSNSDTTEGKKLKKSIMKSELETEDIVEHEELLENSAEEDDETNSPSRKNAKISSGRKIVAEKIAEVVRKSYESTTEFETTSAQMIKLAEAVVSKQVEPIIETPKGPSLVLASSIINHSSDEPNSTTESHTTPDQIRSNGELKKDKVETMSKSEEIITGAKKRRGRASMKEDNGVSAPPPVEKSEITSIDEKSKSPILPEQGLTRSKRDKRKKQVFDPSDPSSNTYSRSVNKKATLSETLPKTKPDSPVYIKRGRKSVPSNADELLHAKAIINKGKGLRHKVESINVTSNSSKLDSSVSDGSNEMKIEDGVNNKETASPISSALIVKTELAETILLCSYCQNTKKNDDSQDDFLSCSLCHSNFHPVCMDYSPELTNRIKEFATSRNMNWHCIECKFCGICNDKIMERPISHADSNGSAITPATEKVEDFGRSLEIILCENCDAGFHAKCTGEVLPKSPKCPWICTTCKADKQETSSLDSSVDSGASTSTRSRRNNRTVKHKTVEPKTLKLEPIPVVPDRDDDNEVESNLFPDDLRLWSKEEVEKYFVHKGLNEEATNLLRQEVDGYSLLLLQREDIVNGMGFRLGPALKVYRLIHELQLKAPVQPHSSWTESEVAENNE